MKKIVSAERSPRNEHKQKMPTEKSFYCDSYVRSFFLSLSCFFFARLICLIYLVALVFIINEQRK